MLLITLIFINSNIDNFCNIVYIVFCFTDTKLQRIFDICKFLIDYFLLKDVNKLRKINNYKNCMLETIL